VKNILRVALVSGVVMMVLSPELAWADDLIPTAERPPGVGDGIDKGMSWLVWGVRIVAVGSFLAVLGMFIMGWLGHQRSEGAKKLLGVMIGILIFSGAGAILQALGM
jgi:hypothetical protein